MTTNAKKDEKVVAVENNKTKQLVTKLYCNKCGELFNNFEDLMRHIFFPTKKKHFFRCNCCKYNVGNTVMDLIQHAKYFCGLANIRKNEDIASKKFPNTHRYYCDICGKGYTSLTALQGHQKYHDNELLCCSFCPKTFVSFSELWNHSKLHTVVFNVKLTCTICSLRFFSTIPYQLHYFLVHSQLIHIPFECSLCPRVVIDDPYTFLLHVQQHIEVTKKEDVPKDQMLGVVAKNTCEVCAEILENKNACELHKAEKHNLESKIDRKCPFCPNMLDLYSITAHLKKHKKDKLKAVPIRNDYKVIKNAKTHFALGYKLPKKLHCSQCNKLFRKPFSLAQHQLTHPKMNISDSSMLSSMQPSTSTSMSYVQSLNSYLPQPECNDCNKTFLSVEALNEHKKIHYLSSEMTKITAGHSAEHIEDTYLAINMRRSTTDEDLNYPSQTPSTFVQRRDPYSSGEILDKQSFLGTSVREVQTGYHLHELSPQHLQYSYVSTRDRSPTPSGQESDPHWTRTAYGTTSEGHEDGDEFNSAYIRDSSPYPVEKYQDHDPQESSISGAYPDYNIENQHSSRHTSRKRSISESEEFQHLTFKGQSAIQGSFSRKCRSRSREFQQPNYEYQLNESSDRRIPSPTPSRKSGSIASREFQPLSSNYKEHPGKSSDQRKPSPTPSRKPESILSREIQPANYNYEDYLSKRSHRPTPSPSFLRRPGSISSREIQSANYDYEDHLITCSGRRTPSPTPSGKPWLASLREFPSQDHDFKDQASDRRDRQAQPLSSLKKLESVTSRELPQPNYNYEDQLSKHSERPPISLNLEDQSFSRDSSTRPSRRRSRSRDYLPQESSYVERRINRNENASSSGVGEYHSFSSNNCSSRDNSSSRDNRSLGDNRYSRDNRSFGDNLYSRDSRSSNYNLDSLDNRSSRDNRDSLDNRSSRDNRSFGDNRYSRDSRSSNYNLNSLDKRSSRDNRFSRDNFPLRNNGSGNNLYSRDGRHNQPNQDGQYDGYFGVYKKK